MKLIPYIRVSTDDQARNGHSPDAQLEGIQKWAAIHGHELTQPIVDAGVSAGKPLEKRKGAAVMMTMLRAGKAEGVVIVALDRMFRDAMEGLAFFRKLGDSGLAIIATSEDLDSSTPMGRMMLTLRLATAQYERELGMARTQAVTNHLRATGKVYGTTPYGCLAVDGNLLRVRDTWAIREMIVGWHRAQRYSLRTIRGMLQDQRVQAPAGGRWWSTSTLAGLIDSHDTLAHLPMYGADAAENMAMATAFNGSRGTNNEHNCKH